MNWCSVSGRMSERAGSSPSRWPLARFAGLAGLVLMLAISQAAGAATIQVPADQPTIKAALGVVEAGDTVVLARGEHVLASDLVVDLPITLTSNYLTTNDTADIFATVVVGDSSIRGLTFGVGATGSRVVGLSFTGMFKALIPEAQMTIEHNRFFDVDSDAVDYEGGGGLCAFNIFENSIDDGIDLDGPVDIVIERNLIRNNGDDGIEKRLHPYVGPTIVTIIRDNEIYGNGEDGIQLIDYDDDSPREISIHHNLIHSNVMAGVGSMADGNTVEDYSASQASERVYVYNNTLANNNHGVTGSSNMIAVNNVVIGNEVGVKGIAGDSVVAHSLFFDNGEDVLSSTLDVGITYEDPGLDGVFVPQVGSACIDTGVAQFTWNGELVLDLAPELYEGGAPNRGARETAAPIFPSSGNTAPAINLGRTVFVVAPESSIALDALTADDGLPGGPLAYAWSAVGPAEVAFSSADAEDTEVTFQQQGRYQLSLAVSDGELESTATLEVDYVADLRDQMFTVDATSLLIEAEDYTFLVAPAGVIEDSTASMGRAIQTSSDDTADRAFTVHQLIFTEEGREYYVWVRLSAETDTESVRLGVALNNAEEVPLLADAVGAYQWRRLPNPLPSPAGSYPLRVRADSPGVRWDALLLTTDEAEVPVGFDPAETADAGTPAPGDAGAADAGTAPGAAGDDIEPDTADSDAEDGSPGSPSAEALPTDISLVGGLANCNCRVDASSSTGAWTWLFLSALLLCRRRTTGAGGFRR